MLDYAGKDATEMFESIGHTNDARATLNKLTIGEIKVSEEEKARRLAAKNKAIQSRGGLDMKTVFIVFLAIVAAFIYSNPEYKAKALSMLGK